MDCEKFATMVVLAVLFLVAVGAMYVVPGDQFGRFMVFAVAVALSSFMGFVAANAVRNCKKKA
jgi:hypothetical protein